VLAAARELNYYANAVARSMKQRSSLTIGLIIGTICNSFFSTVVRAIESTVLRHGYKVIVCNTDENIEMELIHARALMEHRVDGIIVSPTANEKARYPGQPRKFTESRYIPSYLIVQ
jgi:DNA-binding LacI/PurR family transcriptional regulator